MTDAMATLFQYKGIAFGISLTSETAGARAFVRCQRQFAPNATVFGHAAQITAAESRITTSYPGIETPNATWRALLGSPAHSSPEENQALGWELSKLTKDRTVFYCEFNDGGFGGLLQGGIQHNNRVVGYVDTAHQAFAPFCARRKDDFQSAALVVERRCNCLHESRQNRIARSLRDNAVKELNIGEPRLWRENPIQ